MVLFLFCLFNPFMPSGLVYLKSLNRPIPKIWVWLFCSLLLSYFVESTVLNANRVDPI